MGTNLTLTFSNTFAVAVLGAVPTKLHVPATGGYLLWNDASGALCYTTYSVDGSVGSTQTASGLLPVISGKAAPTAASILFAFTAGVAFSAVEAFIARTPDSSSV